MAELPLLHSASFPTIQGLPAQKKSKFHPSTFNQLPPALKFQRSKVHLFTQDDAQTSPITSGYQLFKKTPSCIPQNSKKIQEDCQYISLHVQFCHGTFNKYKYNFRKKKLITTWLLTMNKN